MAPMQRLIFMMLDGAQAIIRVTRCERNNAHNLGIIAVNAPLRLRTEKRFV